MRLITVQHREAYKTLINKGIYRAEASRVSDVLRKPYKFMREQFGWDSTPVFLSPVGYYVEMSGAKFDKEHIAIELEIPDELCKIQNYYDWTDFIYFVEQPSEFKDTFTTAEFSDEYDWGKTILNIIPEKDSEYALQVTVKELRKEWVIGVLEDVSKLESMHGDNSGSRVLKELSYYK